MTGQAGCWGLRHSRPIVCCDVAEAHRNHVTAPAFNPRCRKASPPPSSKESATRVSTNETSRRSSPASDEAWWRSAVVYEIAAISFQDSNGDGQGDLPGL